ncbi:MAG: hypothetical protein IKG46_01720 [Solobacterium sp.]|jgi:hypothetical protein|nr:hypothetical protein [Solobacterium sp.]
MISLFLSIGMMFLMLFSANYLVMGLRRGNRKMVIITLAATLAVSALAMWVFLRFAV